MSENKWILVNESGKVVQPGHLVGGTSPIEKVTKIIDKYSIETSSQNPETGEDVTHTRTIPSEWRIFDASSPEVMLGNIADWYSMMLSWKRRAEVAEKTIDQATEQIKQDLAGHVSPSEYIEQCREVMQILGINETRTVNLTVEFTYDIEVELDWDIDVSELDADDFEPAEGPTSYSYDVVHSDLTDSNIRRW
jgi:hypothetical protein